MAPGTVHPENSAELYASFRIHPETLAIEHLLPFVSQAVKINQQKDKRLFALARITAQTASLHKAFCHILKNEEWDFAALYLDAIDHYCHGFMKYHPPKRDHISQPDFEIYHNVIKAAYQFHDMMLGQILSLTSEDTTIILISDHGFQPDHLRPKHIPKEPAGPAYEHSPYGIFCMKGPGIKKDELIYGASLLDITPTILKIFNLPTGKDMDGKVLLNVFEKPSISKFVDSWETVERFMVPIAVHSERGSSAESQMLHQLAELGYIENQNQEKAKRIKTTRDECNFNLAKSYLDGGQMDMALPILKKLNQENPEVTRYAFRLASCYQAIGEFKKCRALIHQLKALELFESPVLDVIEASLLMGERQPLKALKLLKASEHKIRPDHARLYFQIASCYVMLQRWADAERALNKELEIDYDDALAHQMLGSVYLNTQRFQNAADALLTSLGLEYNNPQGHVLLGRALYFLGHYEKATEALEIGLSMMPANNNARELLIDIYEKYLDQPTKAMTHREKLVSNIRGTITIVSGLPRSGTSMLMQMLKAGGMEIFTDDKRHADDNNPKGYLEHEIVKSLPRNKRWLNHAVNKAVKIVANLLPHLPGTFQYKILFIERNLHEVLASQRSMLERLGKPTQKETMPLPLHQAYKQNVEKVKNWVSTQNNISILYIRHMVFYTKLDKPLLNQDF